MTVFLGAVLTVAVCVALAWVPIVTLGGSHGGHK